jgi:hypothetical protein
MTEPIYPVPVKTYESVHEIGVGWCIPMLPATVINPTDKVCENCLSTDGVVYWRKIKASGPLHLFKDNFGNTREMSCRLYSAPCPECRPTSTLPEEPEEHEDNKGADQWWEK